MIRITKQQTRRLRLAVRKVTTFLNEQQYYPRANVLLDRVVLALVSKGVKVSEGVLCLIEAGLGEEAFGLSRTLVEVALSCVSSLSAIQNDAHVGLRNIRRSGNWSWYGVY